MKFMKWFLANNVWKENLDFNKFQELEKQIYCDMFPHNNTIFDDKEEEYTEEDSTWRPKENKNAIKKGDGKKKRRLEEVEIKDSSEDNNSYGDEYSDLLSGEDIVGNCIMT